MAAARLIGEKNFGRWQGGVAVDGTPIKAANAARESHPSLMLGGMCVKASIVVTRKLMIRL